MAGRKSNLMQAVEHDLIGHLQSGMTIKDACALVGIPEQTYHRWCQSNREFCESATRARSKGRQTAVVVIRSAMTHTLQDETGRPVPTPQATEAAKWYLERTDPEHWGKRTYHYHQFEVFRKFCEERKLSAGDMLELYMQELAALDRIPSNGSTEGSASG